MESQSIATPAAAHAAYLHFAETVHRAMAENIELQMRLLQQMAANGEAIPALTATPRAPQPAPPAFDRTMCMEFAVGSIAAMLGPEFAEVDSFPTRVRLPDEPLMLVDRIVAVEGEPRSMTSGRVVTEHDVSADRWYLDGGRIPTCIAVEAGQADLFLSGYLGIDFITRGQAVYRLLDAVVTFHRALPVPGDVIRYDIRIEHFFRQDQTYLFRFNFEGTVNGEPLLSMKNGCAGFFTAAELAAGKGIVHTEFDLLPQPGKRPTTGASWPPWRPKRTTTGRSTPCAPATSPALRPALCRSAAAAAGDVAARAAEAGRPGGAPRPRRRPVRPRPDPRRSRHPSRRLVPDLPLLRRPRHARHPDVRVLPAHAADLPAAAGLGRRSG